LAALSIFHESLNASHSGTARGTALIGFLVQARMRERCSPRRRSTPRQDMHKTVVPRFCSSSSDRLLWWPGPRSVDYIGHANFMARHSQADRAVGTGPPTNPGNFLIERVRRVPAFLCVNRVSEWLHNRGSPAARRSLKHLGHWLGMLEPADRPPGGPA